MRDAIAQGSFWNGLSDTTFLFFLALLLMYTFILIQRKTLALCVPVHRRTKCHPFSQALPVCRLVSIPRVEYSGSDGIEAARQTLEAKNDGDSA